MSETIGADIKAVIFDWDDTLVDTIGTKWPQHKHVARTFLNRHLRDEDLRRHWGVPMSKLIKKLYEVDDTGAEKILSALTAVDNDFPKKLFGYSMGVVESIRFTGRPVGLVTAHSRDGLERDFKQLSVTSKLFDYIQTEEDTSHHKPELEVFDPTIAWLGSCAILPHEAVYIGDGQHDREAALGAGLQFIGVATGIVSAEEFVSAGSIAIGSLEDLLLAS